MEVGQIVENFNPHEIFLIPEVRTMIIKHVIHDDNGKLLVDEVKKCREVCPSWTGSTTEALRQSKEPLFHFRLDENYFFEETEYRVWKLKILDLKETVAMASPPVALHVHETYFRGTHSRRLEEPLETLRDILVYVDINLRYKTSLRYYPEEFDLPMLNDLRIKFASLGREPAVALLHRLQQGSRTLRKLKFESDIVVSTYFYDLSWITMSETLTSIDFTQVETQYSEMLATSHLPNLKSLSLRIIELGLTPISEELLSSILENVRSSLEHLFVTGAYRPITPHYFCFPVMDKLTKVEIDTSHIELEQKAQSLETYLPGLVTLRLKYQSLHRLRPWISSASRLPLVTKLQVDCWNEAKCQLWGNPANDSEFNQETANQMAETFPNLKELVIELACVRCNLNTFTTLFREMNQLEKLRVSLSNRDLDIWNAALLGVPLQIARDIRSGSAHEFDASLSVMNLSNLKELWLEAPCMITEMDQTNKANGVDPPLINFLFENALLRMPNLKRLTLQGNIWTSLEMKQQWEEEENGRKLILLDV